MSVCRTTKMDLRHCKCSRCVPNSKEPVRVVRVQSKKVS